MEASAQGVPGYFVWQVSGQPAVVHLNLNVVDRMAAEIMRGFGAVPKRGAEVGGVFIGTVTQEKDKVSTIRIEDFEAIPCTYTRGPSYLLTDAERALFDDVFQRRGKEIVGYYRSHTREGLGLQPEDVQLLDRLFPTPTQIALLVKPFATKPSVAGFFLRENGRPSGKFSATTPLEFPFRRAEMIGAEPPPRPPLQERPEKKKDPEKADPPEPAATSEAWRDERIFSAEPERAFKKPAADLPEQPRSTSRTGMWMVASFVFLLLGVLLGYEASRITAPHRGVSDFALSLAVERAGENLTIRWNPTARAILSARSGLLDIDDGGETRHVELDRSNLDNGRMIYRNASGKVRFRLVIYLDSGLSVTEALDWPR